MKNLILTICSLLFLAAAGATLPAFRSLAETAGPEPVASGLTGRTSSAPQIPGPAAAAKPVNAISAAARPGGGADEAAFPRRDARRAIVPKSSESISTYGTLAAAVDAIGAAETTLLLDRDSTCSTALTIPRTLTLLPSNNAKITESGTCTINFQGVGVTADPSVEVFEDFEPGDVKFTGSYPESFSPVWWGAKGDGKTNDLPAFDSTIAAMQATSPADPKASAGRVGGKIFIPKPPGNWSYRLEGTWHIYRPVTIEGSTWNEYRGTILGFTGMTGIEIHRYNTFQPPAAAGSGSMADGTVIRNLALFGTQPTPPDAATVDISGLAFKKTGGAALQNRDRGQGFRWRDFTLVIDTVDEAAQTFTIERPRFSVVAQNGSAIVRNGTPFTWAANQWQGATVVINGGAYTVAANTATQMTLSAPYDSGHNTRSYDAVQQFGGDAEITALAAAGGETVYLLRAHGIDAHAQFKAENVFVREFNGNGVNIDTDFSTGDTNANYSTLINVSAKNNRGHGFFLAGFNTNVITLISLDATNNAGYGFGIHDFHGNTYIGAHSSFNGQGAYVAFGNSGEPRNTFENCYSEGGQPSSLVGNTTVVSGIHGAGFGTRSTESRIDGRAGVLFTGTVSASGKNNSFYPSTYTIGGRNEPDNDFPIRILASFGIAEEPYSLAKTAGNPLVVYGGHSFVHTAAGHYFFWGLENISYAVTDQLNANGPERFVFPQGFFIGDPAAGTQRWVSTGPTPPAAHRSIAYSQVTTAGTLVRRTPTGASHRAFFDASGGWTGATIRIGGVDYKISSVTDENTLVLTVPAGAQKDQLAEIKVPYQRGDIVFNINPAAGDAAFWINTAAGAPGTWTKAGFAPLPAAGTLDFPAIPAQAQSELTVPAAGAAAGDLASCGPATPLENGLLWSASVSAADRVTIRLGNITAAAIDPAPKAWKCKVEKF